MTEARVSFLNWRPDLEDTEHDGLTTANNVLHDVDGYEPLHLGSAGRFVTTGGLASVTSLVSKPVGAQGDQFCGWIAANGVHVGINGVTAAAATTGYPTAITSATTINGGEISAFDVCELNGKIFFVVEGSIQTAVPNTVVSLAMSGYMDF